MLFLAVAMEKNINTYLDLYNRIGEMYEVKEKAFKSAMDDINAQFGHLLEQSDPEEESVVPELRKVQVEPKKRKESRVSKKKTSLSRKTANLNQDDDDGLFRKSSRVAAKAKIHPVLSLVDDVVTAEAEEVEAVETEPVNKTTSPIQPPSKPRRKNESHERSDDHFVVPEIPKMKTVKEKTEARASRKNALLNATVTISTANSNNQNEEEGYRKSSRIASKTKVVPVVPVVALEPSITTATSNETITLSKDDVAKFWDVHRATPLDETVCTLDIQNPLCNSTPMASPKHEKSEMQQTPTLVPVTECVEKPNSVKKKVEEFEKKAEETLASIKSTPEKKEVLELAGLMIVKTRGKKITTNAAPKSKLGKKANVLRERNINIKPPVLQIPKLTPKGNVEEIKRKETRTVTAQREAAKHALHVIFKENLEKQKQKVFQAKTVEEQEYDIERLEDESSEDEDHPKKKIPVWSTREIREHPLAVQSWLDKEETVYPWFFSKKHRTPDLEELFSSKIKMRPRTSSAVWNTRSNFH